MRLDRLLDGAALDVGTVDVGTVDVGTVDVTGVAYDSRTVHAGELFCCLPGLRADGHRFAAVAVARGAAALLCERTLPLDVPQVVVADARAAMAPMAAAFWGRPSRALAVAGITGTNGKTTTAHLLRSVLQAAGRPCALIGTLTGARTTPESPDLQALLAERLEAGDEAVAMEVSSHALALHRVDATWFSVAVFTNLGRDHLDFHGTTEAYFRAKARLFEPDLAAAAVVNTDDPHGRLLLDASRVPTRGYSLADAADLDVQPRGSGFRWEGRSVRLRIGGRFNVLNALAAAAAARALGVDADAVAGGLSDAPPVPGRFEAIDAGQPFVVIVDYAHTPDALEQVLSAARTGTARRVIVVFGCGGDRDRAKRPEMGEVTTRLADVTVLTSDNPRSEDPAAIIEAVRAGGRHGRDLRVEVDRRAAIAMALAEAGPGDVVVVAGKGHETGQEVGGRVLPFDDRQVVRELLEAGG